MTDLVPASPLCRGLQTPCLSVTTELPPDGAPFVCKAVHTSHPAQAPPDPLYLPFLIQSAWIIQTSSDCLLALLHSSQYSASLYFSKTTFIHLLGYFFFFFWQHSTICGSQFSDQKQNQCSLQWKQSLNHWTARDNPGNVFFILYYFIFLFIVYIILTYTVFLYLFQLNDWLHRAGTIFVKLTSAFLMSNNAWTVQVHP